jgi:hypothetical protein
MKIINKFWKLEQIINVIIIIFCKLSKCINHLLKQFHIGNQRLAIYNKFIKHLFSTGMTLNYIHQVTNFAIPIRLKLLSYDESHI